MKDAFIYDGIRSPFGRFAGALAPIRPDDLAAAVLSELISRNNLSGHEIEDVILGNTNQAGEDSRNLARHAALLAGLPVSVAGVTLNRLCGSGLAAVADASRSVNCHQGELFIAGGAEVMSRAPWVMAKATSPFSRSQTVEDSMIGARFPNPKITEVFGNPTMAETADNVGHELGITREQSDHFALESQIKFEKARASGFFDEELTAIKVPAIRRKAEPIKVESDEHPRPDSNLDSLASLRTLMPDGLVTAGNASGINDGAAALLVGSLDGGSSLGLTPRAKIVSAAVAGVEPRLMGLGPVPAVEKALQRARLELKDMDVIEINEAFATQVLGCLKQLELAFDESRVNPNGGAIAVGHPLGASGARIVLTAMRHLEKIGGRYGLVSMCIGVGQGIAIVLERTGQG